ncbi:MAG: winged helix-turn-helix domain-containing protein [Phycisphaerales bacterium]|nr:winged helix-turn-helix domain-containing protein [Phycisphaerales bacterium]MCI0629244.1 winged helix-turn-helix domain-containing protein [Phycisphaerales bacterium]MCI0675875.1 winged helix-turn-helix domain-containing protein [Phycisphaerales bacterium]
MSQGRRRTRIVRYAVLFEDFLSTLGGGQRFEILRVLAESPRTVTQIADALFLKLNAVSRDLAALEELGLVTFTQVKTSRIYQLSDRVRFFRKDQMLQVVIVNPAGQWVLFHIDETTEPSRQMAPPPHAFVEFN